MSMNLDNVIRALRQENGKLRDEKEELLMQIADLRRQLLVGQPYEIHFKHLSRSCLIILNVLMQREFPRHDAFLLALYGHVEDRERNIRIFKVFVCNLRRILKPLGIEIKGKWGHGYYMPQASKEIVRTLS